MKIKGYQPINNQDAFNFAWNWLVTENRPACYDKDGFCLYRKHQEDGTVFTCIIGAMIPDELVKDTFTNIKSLCEENNLIKDWFKNIDIELLLDIQKIHDTSAIDRDICTYNRAIKMRSVANQYNLICPKECRLLL